MTPAAKTLGSWIAAYCLLSISAPAFAQTSIVAGSVRDETGGALPAVNVELRATTGAAVETITSSSGEYAFADVSPGRYRLSFTLINFASLIRDVTVTASPLRADVTLHLSLNADVTVTGKRTFGNLADVENPAENLVGIAQSASQGAITAAQIDSRPRMRAGDLLETIPGVVIRQHSGEGKANQYYLRGFNLDHGTDFATTVAGMPVNMPSHGHGQGYSDLNFLIPELVSGVQFEKGPYYADQGDFSAAGAATISYANTLARTLARIGGGQHGWGRVLVASTPRLWNGNLLVAFEANRHDGPWVRPDDFQRQNAVVRYSAGDARDGFAVTAMGYDGQWNSTDQVPARAMTSGMIPRYGAIDPTDGGAARRYSGSFEWQRSRGNAVTTASAYLIGSRLNLFSNFTYNLDDPVNGDQFEQFDDRMVSGGRLTRRTLDRWDGRDVRQTYGVQMRNDAIGAVGLYKTKARVRLSTTREDEVLQTSGSGFYENEVQWAGKIRTQLGLRFDTYRFRVNSDLPQNGGTTTASMASPKAGAAFGPWRGTELYVNGGYGFHSNDARGTTITVDPLTGEPVHRVTPLVRARGGEAGVRTIAIPRVQSTLAVWTLDLASELVFVGDAGTTDAGRPSRRTGIEWTNYYRPTPHLTFDADLAFSSARFRDGDPASNRVPGTAGTIVSMGAAVSDWRNIFGSVRWRYFGSRPLTEDNSVRSASTSLVNGEVGFRFRNDLRIVLEGFNLFNSDASDIDYYYRSRLPGEPLDGVNDIHTHPMAGRTARISLRVGF